MKPYDLGQKVLRILYFVTQWPPSSPHPGRYCFVGVGNDPAGLQHFFFGGEVGGGEEGEYFFVVAIAFKSFILKHDTATSIFLNISIQDCGFYLKIINDIKV